MADFSVVKKLKLLFDTVISTPFFIFYFVVGLITLYLIIVDIKKNKKISKIGYISSIILLINFFLINYFTTIIKVLDVFVEIILKALYFPNLGIYISMLIIVNFTFLIVLLSKNNKMFKKIITTVIALLIDFMFVIIISIISKNNIDITSDIKLYTDSKVLTFLQISMALFAVLYLIYLLIYLHTRFKKLDKKDVSNNLNLEIDLNSKPTFSSKSIKYIKVIDFNKVDN